MAEEACAKDKLSSSDFDMFILVLDLKKYRCFVFCTQLLKRFAFGPIADESLCPRHCLFTALAGSEGPHVSSTGTIAARHPRWYMQQPADGRTHAVGRAEHAQAAQGSHFRRRLQQLGYDPYGIGYNEVYQAGVTPGFVNLDINRETGLHLGVGTVAVDVSADKNYVGFGVGNLLGVGAARDRGWNLQLGGGNVLDASVTKDAGLGLWILDGSNVAVASTPGVASSPTAVGTMAAPVVIDSIDYDPNGDITATDRRACEGGVVEWTTGNKYRCKYKKAQLVQVPPGGMSSGYAAR
eukprot:gene9682-9840_t